MKDANTDLLAINTIRFLAVDMVEKAKSGHPGLPLGAAAPAYILWQRLLNHNPANPAWCNRDRFILSAGHGSALLYALLHVHGYSLSLEDLRAFRQLGSRTPGHPEYGHTPGVDATTGPLGHGVAMGVGMALAQRFLASQFNRPGFDVVDNFVYALVSDGDLMEGVAAEAVSLAGTLKLGRLIYLYDSNGISIEGSTSLAFTEDVAARFKACHWQVLQVDNSEDLDALEKALYAAKGNLSQPSLIIVKTHIGLGSPKQDNASSHGEPLGQTAMDATRAFYGWPAEAFHMPEQVRAVQKQALAKGQALEAAWQKMFKNYEATHPQLAARFIAQQKGQLPEGWQEALPVFSPDKKIATRAASGQVLNALAAALPNLLGGSADLAPSNKTVIEGSGSLNQEGPQCGRNIHFGVREHAMGAIVNGMALYGGVLPFAATFFVFADFIRPSLRLAALMGLKSIFIFTHDSVAVGEDGPTHQPVEHLMSLRVIPGLTVIRPADANETSGAWQAALSKPGPCALVLTRQDLPVLGTKASEVDRGAYIISHEREELAGVIVASGSEVSLALEVVDKMGPAGRGFRVVSMPSWELFASQPESYRQAILPPPASADDLWRISLEAGVSLGWERYVGAAGPKTMLFGIESFGLSAPGGQVLTHFGFNAEAIANKILNSMG